MQEFAATIKKQGPNPYVDIPETVSRAFARHALAGRVRVSGALNGSPIQATLIPVGKGRHRLYVNGGMRSAAGVGAGDTVRFALKATSPDAVQVAADVRAGLRKATGAEAAFDSLSPSHRRELLRYVDDARSPQTRQKRIQRSIEHVLATPLAKHKRAGRARSQDLRGHEAMKERPLWICPNCGNEFVNKNQYHSCKRYALDDLFDGKPAAIRKLFDRFRKMVEACGPVKVLAYRDKVGFMVRVRFAGAVPKRGWLDIGFWLARRVEHPRFHRIQTIYPNAHVHLLRIRQPGELDSQLAAWIREAYTVGRQEHLG